MFCFLDTHKKVKVELRIIKVFILKKVKDFQKKLRKKYKPKKKLRINKKINLGLHLLSLYVDYLNLVSIKKRRNDLNTLNKICFSKNVILNNLIPHSFKSILQSLKDGSRCV